MTGPQRKTHLLLWLVLGPLALAGLILAIYLRPLEPVHDGDLPGLDAVQMPSKANATAGQADSGGAQ